MMGYVYYFGMSTPVRVSAAETQMGIAELRAQLGSQVDLAFYRDQVVHVMRHQRRMAVLISPERYEALQLAARRHRSPVRVDGG